MKLNRSLMITILMIVLAICTGILLSGCASLRGGKDAEPEMESPQRIDKQSTAVEETSGGSPEVRKGPVVSTGGSGEKPPAQKASLKVDEDRIRINASYLLQGLDRILPETLPDINWNRIGTALGGILAMSLIYGLAFALARLPLRRRSAGRSGGGQQTGEHARVSVPQ
jgi:uncharacterized protein YceK